ncbi:MAG: hypothetical protein L7G93_06875, partial [Acidilobus sp.]|nr:hypothetical protein [Acidilobus sp.]
CEVTYEPPPRRARPRVGGVQLPYRFVLPYGHRLIPVPPHPARGLIGLGGVQGHPRDPTS